MQVKLLRRQTEPFMFFALISITIAFIFSTVVVSSGRKASGRGFYLVSFEYNLNTQPPRMLMHKRANTDPAAAFSRVTESLISVAQSSSMPVTPTATSTPTSASSATPSSMPTASPMANSTSEIQAASKSKFRESVQALLTADEINTNMTFSEVRVSYHGVCTQIYPNGSRDDSWHCGDVKSTRTLADMAGGDPFDLIDIGAYYKDKMAFSLPWWFAVACLGVSTVALIVGSLPLIPTHPAVNQVAAVSGVLGSGSLLIGLLLAHVTSNAVVTLTNLLTVGTVEAHIGRMNQTFGWSAFVLSCLGAFAVSIIALGEFALLKAEQRSNMVIDHAVSKGMERLPFSNPIQHAPHPGAPVPSPSPSQRGLGRTMGGVGLDDLRDLAQAKSRKEALYMVAGKISTKRNDEHV